VESGESNWSAHADASRKPVCNVACDSIRLVGFFKSALRTLIEIPSCLREDKTVGWAKYVSYLKAFFEQHDGL
jgi:hypothetical protein